MSGHLIGNGTRHGSIGARPRAQAWGRITACVCSTVVLVACDSGDATTQSAAVPIRSVKVLEVNGASASRERVLAATVVSADSQNLSFRVGGAITSLPVKVGARLNESAPVATLDLQPFKLAEKEARAQVAQADANYRNANSQYRRARELYSTEAASLSDLENAKASASSARANLALAREGLNAARLNMGYATLTNPSDNCQVVSVPVSVNQNINAGQTIATTACGDKLRLRTIVPENLVNAIQLGMPVSAKLQSGSVGLTGKVIEVAVSSNNSAGYAVEAELTTPPTGVRVGMAAQITFALTSSEERIVVPLIAVLSDRQGKYVFVAEPAGDNYKIVRQTVKTGELGNDGIGISDGLKPGQRVVVAGMSRLTEGMQVTLYAGARQ